MQTIEEALEKLKASNFRSGFSLKEKEKAYVRKKGMDTKTIPRIIRAVSNIKYSFSFTFHMHHFQDTEAQNVLILVERQSN
ncbi:MAG TPA: hypothetical protein DEP27_00060 [Ruminococcaceae bacterium]|nr:hypothetical protein [Oscillospiraceae bacterium]